MSFFDEMIDDFLASCERGRNIPFGEFERGYMSGDILPADCYEIEETSMSKKEKKPKIEVFLDEADIKALEKIAEETGTSRSGAARSLILKGLREAEGKR